MMMKTIFFTALIAGITSTALAQQKTDTVIVELAKTSRVIFTIKDHADLPTLKQYDFQALFSDILNRVEQKAGVKTEDTVQTEITSEPAEVVWEDDADDQDWYGSRSGRYRHKQSIHSFNVDFGLNNYLQEGKFPDANALYAVRPWGSWYVGINSVQRTRIGGKFYIEWGLGLSWYSFKFENDNAVLSKDENGVVFAEDIDPARNYSKSKISMSFVNGSFIPILDFGGYGKKARFWDANSSKFRIGFGPYAGYRIGSHAKVVYKENGDKEKDKNKDNFSLENFRYGLRLQLGIRSTDLFFNYDLNELFTDQPNNPKLNAFSFGIIF